jgi:ACS family hexuronate transporter-like MFS transporter
LNSNNPAAIRGRWVVVGIFLLSSTINYLDRQTLATVAPLVRAELHLNNADYGLILAAFSIAYAAAAPFAGLLIDRIGLSRGITLAVSAWSLASIATGFARGLPSLLVCRAWLGVAEAGGIPAAGKAIQHYLKPEERALGNGLNQTGVFLGAILAPPVATWLAIHYGWPSAFLATGAAGLFWIALWRIIQSGAHRGEARPEPTPAQPVSRSLRLLQQPRAWGLMAANALSMVIYSLWSNWTTLYLVEAHHLTLAQAAWFAWLPPLAAMIGGLAGGWLSLRWARDAASPVSARLRVCLACGVLALGTAAIPLLSGALWASAGISLSILAVSAFSVNLYTLPLDLFEPAHAAFAISLLVSAYGAMQAVLSPALGATIDRYGYTPVCVAVSLTPLAAYGVLRLAKI